MNNQELVKVFVPITRLNEEERTVEGFCFCNEKVESDGYRILRSAMEEATDDYMDWGAVRAMHQPIAAGTALTIEWNKKGCFLRSKIVDDAEWKKCQEGVYKGYSIGVRPLVFRDDSVTKVRWIENSLVDRPADPDAVFTLMRREESETPPDPIGEPEVQEEAESEEQQIEESVDAEEITMASHGTLARIAELESRAERYQLRLEAAEAEIKRLENMPPKRVFVRTEGVTREFLINRFNQSQKEVNDLKEEYAKIMSLDTGATLAERNKAADRVSEIKDRLKALGEGEPA